MDTVKAEQRKRDAEQQLNDLLDAEVAYKFMAGCAEFMTKEGLDLLKAAARNQQRWAFRLLTDAMKVVARLEMAKSMAQGRQQGPPVRVRTRFATEGEKV